MNRDWLESQLSAGKSLGQIGVETGRHGSTVAYWARKHGLKPVGADKFTARGAPDRERLETLAATGATLVEIARELDRSVATIRHWLRRWGIERADGRVTGIDPATAPVILELRCARHGITAFRLEARGSYRCKRCRQQHVSEWRRRVKRVLVEEAGGGCHLCGYERCPAALQFHHMDPGEKSFALSHEGVTRSLARARREARKCVLLCGNCHAEVEAGYVRLEAEDGARREAPRGGFEPPRTD